MNSKFYILLTLILSLGLKNSWANGNILIIMADDLGLDTFAPYSITNDPANTPNLNDMAEEGLLFKNAWAFPTCSPTRAALMTGRHAFRTGVGQPYIAGNQDTLSHEEVTLAEVIKAERPEYQLGVVGKWHLNSGDGVAEDDPMQYGFDYHSGALGAAVQDYRQWNKTTNGITEASTTYVTEDNVNEAKDFILKNDTEGKPWLLWVAFNAPHTPYHKPPVELLTTQDSINLPGPDHPDYQASLDDFPREYFKAMVEAMDHEIGRLMETVDLKGTTVIFLSDNGTPVDAATLPYGADKSKTTLYQGGVHVPFFVLGESVRNKGRTVEPLIQTVDVFSTILDLLDISSDTDMLSYITIDGTSFLDLIKDEDVLLERDWVLSEQFNGNNNQGRALPLPINGNFNLGGNFNNPNNAFIPGKTIRNEQYKLIRFDDGGEEFYNLKIDPYESENLLNTTTELSEEEAINYIDLSDTLNLLLSSE